MARTSTPDRINADGSKTIRIKRACNGCGRDIGDASESELNAVVDGRPLPDVREECGCSQAPAQLGQTCTVGSGRTRWEIIKIGQDGVLHLSKVGGDGYTNRWANPAEITNVQDRTLTHTLGEVLAKRHEAAEAAALLSEQIRRHAKPSAVAQLKADVEVKTNRYIRIYAGHLNEIQFSDGAA